MSFTYPLNLVAFSGGLRRWYNPPWFSENIPSTPYNPLVLRESFEKVSYCAEFA